MFEQVFKNIDNALRKDAGCSSELDYVEQTSWILFLKYLNDLEKIKEQEAELEGRNYEGLLEESYRWDVWAAPKDNSGNIDHNKTLTGDDLIDFVNQKLFPYLKKFRASAESPETLQYKIGEIFSELKNRIQSGYTLREVIDLVDELKFQSHEEKHEMSHLYEARIQKMGNAGRNGGEYYTPRPLIKTIVSVVDPKIGETIYDGAVGSAGFLAEAFEYLKSQRKGSKDEDILQKKTFYGKEKKSLAYVIGIMNLILHGLESPNIVHTNTLKENIMDLEEKDKFDIVLANPPFGGSERPEVQGNKIYGWYGLMKEGSQKGYYGFNVFRRGRMITSYDKIGIPEHATVARITGEIHMDHVPVTHNKREFIKDSKEYILAEEVLSKQFKNIVKKMKYI